MLTLRPATEDEHRLVIHSWIRSYRKARGVQGMAVWLWDKWRRLGIVELLKEATLVVAEDDEVPGEVLGWSCFSQAGKDPLLVHYVYVKPEYRKNGIGSLLLHAAVEQADDRGVRQSHRTPEGERLMDRTLLARSADPTPGDRAHALRTAG